MKRIFSVICVACAAILTISCNKEENDYFKGHDYVDLGLPSGILWATCNLGATTPEGYGEFYGWGMTTPYTEGESADYETYFKKIGGTGVDSGDCGTKDDPIGDYVRHADGPGAKYYITTDAGTADGIGGTEWDAARKSWKGQWRMPTRVEFDELRDENNCSWEWITENGVEGVKITSKKNNNSIFMPAAGYYNESSVYSRATTCGFWTSTPHPIMRGDNPLITNFYKTFNGYSNVPRYFGYPIRPVIMPKNK